MFYFKVVFESVLYGTVVRSCLFTICSLCFRLRVVMGMKQTTLYNLRKIGSKMRKAKQKSTFKNGVLVEYY